MKRPAGVGQRLHTWRIRKNLTLEQVGEMLDVSAMTVLRWEKGKSEPNDRSRYRIERVLNGKAA